ncbi:Spermine synthase [Carabus blaptoides fortunei]
MSGSTIKIFASDFGTLTTLRIYNHGLITINIEYFKWENQKPVIWFERSEEIEKSLIGSISALDRSQVYVPIKRGTFSRFYLTSDDRILEYDIDRVLFEERSPFQKVQVVHSMSLRNMLVLDGLQNISEADLIYTETLMQRGVENYKNKEIVILGGGDGALLYELLKENPRYVTMLELDDTVMRACNEHMKSVCGDVLDKKTTLYYQIIVGNCMKSLNLFRSEGRKFDYVFGDLTYVPISDTSSGEKWDFIRKILQMSFEILKPTGKFMTHCNGVNCPEALKMYESELKKLTPPVTINKATAYIPSFYEDWVFYQINFAEKP